MHNSKMSFVTVRKTVVDFSVFRVQLVNIEGESFSTFIEVIIIYAMPVQKKALNIVYYTLNSLTLF